MLSHEIIKHKPHIVVQSSSWTGGQRFENKSSIVDNHTLSEFLKNHHNVGEFIRYNSGPNIEVYTSAQINYVLYIEREFSKLAYDFRGQPETHLILQCDPNSYKPWVRWVDPRDYVSIMETDYKKYVNDKLSDYIETVKSTHETYKKAKGISE